MNTKWWKTAFAVLLALCLAVGISACTQNKDDTPENYTVTFTGEGVTFDGAAVAEEGEDYTFRLTPQAGYEAGAEFAVAATVGGETAQVAENDGTYTISAVSGDVAVTVTGMVRVYNVTFTGEGVTSSGAATARGGVDYTFRLTLAEGYQKGAEFAVAATVGGETAQVTENDGTYTISAVSGDVAVTVTGAEKISYTVTAPAAEGIEFTGESSVLYGEDYTFTVGFETGYQKGANFAVAATVGGRAAQVTENDGTYTISAVKGNVAITVSGVERKTFSVEMSAVTGARIEGEKTVAYGDDYVFEVVIEEGYEKGADFAVTNAGAPLQPGDNGKYTIENVVSLIVLQVTGVEAIRYDVTFRCEEFDDALQNTSETISYGAASYSFEIELNEQYSQSEGKFEVYWKTTEGSETKLEPNGEGVYSMSNPHADIEIVVKNVALNEYKVTFLRNAYIVYETQVKWGEKLSAEQLGAAQQALVKDLGDGVQFKAWAEPVDTPITEETSISGLTTLQWGDEIAGGSALKGAQEVSLQAGEYSADGFSKVYTNAAVTVTDLFAAIDLSGYGEVRFALKLSGGWLLLSGWSEYIDYVGEWFDVSLVKMSDSGHWRLTIAAPVNYNSEDGPATTGFSITKEVKADSATLAAVLQTVTSDATAPFGISVTELRGSTATVWGFGIDETAFTAQSALSEESAPFGFDRVYHLTAILYRENKSAVDITGFSEVRFAFKSTQYFLIDDWTVYMKEDWNDWTTVSLVNKGENGEDETVWGVTVYGTVFTGSDNSNPYYCEYTGSTLAEILPWYSNETADIYVTELRADSAWPTVGEQIAEEIVPGATQSYTIVPAGFEKLFTYTLSAADFGFAEINISEYTEVCFAVKVSTWVIFPDWTNYYDARGFAVYTLKQTEPGKWQVTLSGVALAKGTNYTYTYEDTDAETTLREVMNCISSEAGATVFITELRGTK